jgi:nicotinate-nucleotide adenylyltransferase
MTVLAAGSIAVFGGSFDPPHIAHTLVAAYVLAAHEVDRVLVVPCFRHPFDKTVAPFEHRVAMCKLAMRDLARTEVSTLEQDLGPTSRTLPLLEALRALYPDAALRLVIGSDLVAETRSWHAFDRIRELAPPLIVPRAGHVDDASAPALPAISSTEVRHRLREGISTDGLVDPQVAAYARAHGLYT